MHIAYPRYHFQLIPNLLKKFQIETKSCEEDSGVDLDETTSTSSSNLQNEFGRLLESQELCDLEFVVGRHTKIQAHIAVVAARSETLKKIIKQAKEENLKKKIKTLNSSSDPILQVSILQKNVTNFIVMNNLNRLNSMLRCQRHSKWLSGSSTPIVSTFQMKTVQTTKQLSC